MDLGRAVLFAGSAVLLISLFTKWYDGGQTGWQVFETLDLVLAALAVAGMVAAVRPDAAPPWAAAAVPGAAVFIVFVQLVDGPPAAGGASPAAGAWVALAGTLLMAAGAALSLAAISVTVEVRESEVRRRVVAVDRRAGRDVEAEEASDLGADTDGPVAEGRRAPSLFGGLGRRGAPEEDEPSPRGGRFAQRDTVAAEPAPVVPGTPAPARPEAADIERTQPLSGLPDAEEDAERP
jgi:hypothetical protein